MIKSDERNSQISNLVDICDKETLIDLPSNPSIPLPSSTFKSSITFSGTNFAARSEDTNVRQLIEMI